MAEKATKRVRGKPLIRAVKRPVSVAWSDDLLKDIDELAEVSVRSRSAQIEYMLRKYLTVEKQLAGITAK
jgi:predicted transcriptional regulator